MLILAGIALATTIDDELLGQWAWELAPKIEQVMGREFVEPPRARLGSWDAVTDGHIAMSRSAPAWLHVGLHARELKAEATGVYFPYTNEAVVFSDEVVARGRELDYSPARLDGAFRCALALELAHALQAQTGGRRAESALVNAQAYLATEAACGATPAMELRYRDRVRAGRPGDGGAFDLGRATPFLHDLAGAVPATAWAAAAHPPDAETVEGWTASRVPLGWDDPEVLLPAVAELRPAGGERTISEAGLLDPFPEPATKRARGGRVCLPVEAAMSLGIAGKLRNAVAVAILATSPDEAACWIEARRRSHAMGDTARFIVGPVDLSMPDRAIPEMGRQWPLEWVLHGQHSYRFLARLVRVSRLGSLSFGDVSLGNLGELWLAVGRRVLGVSYQGGVLPSGTMARALRELVDLDLSETPRPVDPAVVSNVEAWRASLAPAPVATSEYLSLRLLPKYAAGDGARCVDQGERWLSRADLGDATPLRRMVEACRALPAR
ncbi:MAG: hypothetical protein FJ102_10660 [Deltaproteobacteria bacterium]|nr:hypothetical protein [Deltaproteobacteria bacterium]